MGKKKKVVFCTPSLTGPTVPYIKALSDSIPLIVDAGWAEGYAQKVGCPYISNARADMLRMALDAKADVIVFLDYDLSWRPEDLLKLVETDGDVVAGTYRFKEENEECPERYMGNWDMNLDWTPKVRESDGCISATLIPAGFLKITKEAVDKFMLAYPELSYGPMYSPTVDLFNHGARGRVWWGEDYSFAQRWKEKCGDLWIVPDLSIDHHSKDKVYAGNLHKFLLRQPGGSEAE